MTLSINVPTSDQWWMWGKREAHINWSMVTCKVVAPVTGTTLRRTGPGAGRLSAVNAIDTQLCGQINSGLTRQRMAV